MGARQIHEAVEALLGETVSENSVSWLLSLHSAVFVRIARGRYVLAGAAQLWASTGHQRRKPVRIYGEPRPLW